LGNGGFAAGPRPFGFPVGFLDLAEAFAGEVTDFLALAGPFLALAGTFLALVGAFLALARPFFVVGERLLGFAARFLIISLPRAPSCPGHASCASPWPGHLRSDAIIRPMPAAGRGEEFLRSCPVLAALPAKALASLTTVARDERYRARDYIFIEGDPAVWFCLVKTGRVRIFRQSRGGKDVVLELLGPGEPFGGVAVIEQRPYPASAQATEPSVVAKLPREAMVALAERHPSIIKEMALMIGRRLRAAHDSVKSLAADPVEARLAATLLRLAEREGTRGPRGLTVPFHLTRQGLADMTGTTVETTIRMVSRWLRDGLILEEDNRLVLVDVPALHDLAEGESD
jgi:CRP-like cAMP-binding protein